jgi:replicative DNA helicase
LKSDDFFVPDNRQVFGAIKGLLTRGLVADATTVSAELGRIEIESPRTFIAALLRAIDTPTSVGSYITDIIDRARRRDIMQLTSEVQAATSNGAD